jgi:hypothetical protein
MEREGFTVSINGSVFVLSSHHPSYDTLKNKIQGGRRITMEVLEEFGWNVEVVELVLIVAGATDDTLIVFFAR